MLGQELNRSPGDHSPVSHHNHTANTKPLSELGDHPLKGFNVRRVPRENLLGHRPPLCIDRHAQNKLGQIPPMVSGVPSLAVLALFIPVHVGRGRIQKKQIQLLIEQIQILKVKLSFQIKPDIVQKPCGR